MWWVISFSLLGSVGAIIGAALLLAFPDTLRQKLLPSLLSYATGTRAVVGQTLLILAGIVTIAFFRFRN